MTYPENGRWLVISHPRSVTVLDAQTLIAVADLALPTEAPTDTSADAFAVAAGQDHQLLVGTGSLPASIEMDPDHDVGDTRGLDGGEDVSPHCSVRRHELNSECSILASIWADCRARRLRTAVDGRAAQTVVSHPE